jgi:FAD dependent oxidoreductase TIGR03364
MSSNAIVIGAGIVGLATARALALKGYQVTIVERTDKAVGASIRNFGMIWPIGQPAGKLYNRAIRSKIIWKEIADKIGLCYNECGSLHTAYYQDEWQVLNELNTAFKNEERAVTLMSKQQIEEKFNGINSNNLIGGLYSSTETIVDPREAIEKVAIYLQEHLKVKFIWGQAVTRVEQGKVYFGNKLVDTDLVCICSGADFETLFPEVFSALAITKCKLQMMRFASTQANFRIGTAVCGGLSLIHYNSFKVAPSLLHLKARYEQEMEAYLNWGIHVMVSQNNNGELTVGDSHEYGLTFDPFDNHHINQLILNYLQQFCNIQDWKLTQTWNGIYPKLTDGNTDVVLNPLSGVYILNGLGGAGMTLSFGFAEEAVHQFA